MLQESVWQRMMRIRIITKNYPVLRGLQGVPVGLFLLILAAFELGWLHFPADWMDLGVLAMAGAFCGALALHVRIGHYYDCRFGCVQQEEMSKFHLTVQVLAGAVLLMAAIQADRTMNLPVSMTGLALALWLFFLWQSTDAFRTHLFMMALLMVLISLLPLAGMTSLSKLFIPGHGGYELAVSLLLIVGGICDHLILMRAFAHTERAHHDQTI